MKPFSRSNVFMKMFWQRIIPPLLMIPILIINACSPIQASLTPNPTDFATYTSTKTPDLSNTTAIEPTLFPSLTPTPTLTLIPTPTQTLAPTRPLLPAPIVPDVSSVISVENAYLLTRLASLGEGDFNTIQLSPDSKYIIIGTSNGVLVLDSTTLEKVLFLPTAMSAWHIRFFDGGTKMTSDDGHQGYLWSFPDGAVIRHVKFPLLEFIGSNNSQIPIPSNDLEYVFSEQHKSTWYGDGVSTVSFDDSQAGLLRTSDGSPEYLVDHKVIAFSSSPDNQLIALSSGEELILTQYYDGKVLTTTKEPDIRNIYFFPDGKTLVAVSTSKISFWNIPDLTLINSISAYGIKKLIFSPNYSVIAALSQDTIRLIRASDPYLINAITGVSITFQNDSKGFTVDNGKALINHFQLNDDLSKIILINSFSGKGLGARQEIPENAGVFSSDNKKLLSIHMVNGFTNIVIYDLFEDSKVELSFVKMFTHRNILGAVWLSQLQTFGLILSHWGSDNCYLAVIDNETESLVKYLNKETYNGYIAALNFSRNSDLLVSAQGSNFVFLWDIMNNGYWELPLAHTDRDTLFNNSRYSVDFDFSSDDSEILFSNSFGDNYLIDTSDFSYRKVENNGRYFFIGNDFIGYANGDEITIAEKNTQKVINSITDYYFNLDFNPLKQYLAIVSNKGLNLWDLSNLRTEKLLFSKEVSTNYAAVGDVIFSSNGDYVAAQVKHDYYFKKTFVWNAGDGSIVFQSEGAYSNSFAFSPDNTMIAISATKPFGSDFAIFEISSGNTVFSTLLHCKANSAPKLSFSPDGKYLAVLCSYGYPQIWGIPITEEPVNTDRVE